MHNSYELIKTFEKEGILRFFIFLLSFCAVGTVRTVGVSVWLTRGPTPWIRVLEKPVVTEVVHVFVGSYGTHRSIACSHKNTPFVSALGLVCLVDSLSSYVLLIFILILSFVHFSHVVSIHIVQPKFEYVFAIILHSTCPHPSYP